MRSEDSLPSPDWSLDQLAEYTRERFKSAGILGRKTALQIWRAGKALLLVRTKLKAERRWTAWAEEKRLPLTSAYEAIRIAEKFEDEGDITGLTAIEAKSIAGKVKPRKGGSDRREVTKVGSQDEQPVPDPRVVTQDGGSALLSTEREEQPAPSPNHPTPEPRTPPADWFERFSAELWGEMEALHHAVLVLPEGTKRQDHPFSAALLLVLIEAGLVSVEEDEGKEVVRVDDEDMVAALAAAEKALDPIFRRLGVTPDVAARHLLVMVQEGRGFVPEPQKPRRKTTRTT